MKIAIAWKKVIIIHANLFRRTNASNETVIHLLNLLRNILLTLTLHDCSCTNISWLIDWLINLPAVGLCLFHTLSGWSKLIMKGYYSTDYALNRSPPNPESIQCCSWKRKWLKGWGLDQTKPTPIQIIFYLDQIHSFALL